MFLNYPEELIEEIRLGNDIVNVVGEYVKLERKGKDYFGLCPFHKEKTPSFSVAPSKQIFYCFGCGKGGNVIQFIMDIENLDFIEALKLLADRANIILPENGSMEDEKKSKMRKVILSVNKEAAKFFFKMLQLPSGKKARMYLRKRGISDRVIVRFGIGYSDDEWDRLYKYLSGKGFEEEHIIKSGLVLKNKRGGYYDRFRARIIFPIFDLRGNVIAFGGRVIDTSKPKYMNSPETIVYNKSRSLYGINFAKSAVSKSLIIVEGYMDVISLHQSGINNAVATLGTALTESQGRILKKYAEELIIAYDTDAAGQAATLRGLDLLSDIGANVKVLTVPDGKDPDEYIKNNGVNKFKKLIETSVPLVEYKIKVEKRNINTEKTEGKVEFLNKAAKILSKIDNRVEREMYVNKMAEEYGITQESLYSEVLRKMETDKSYKKATFNTALKYNDGIKKNLKFEQPYRVDGIKYDEMFIIALLCIDNSLYKHIKNVINVEMFFNKENREIAKIVFERLGNNIGIAPGELLNLVKEEMVKDFSRIISDECHCDDNKKAIMGKIRNIEVYRINKRQKEILGLLKNEGSLLEGDVKKLENELRVLTIQLKNKKRN